jgi:hypothetical protein
MLDDELAKMTGQEIIAVMQTDTRLARVRRAMVQGMTAIEQAQAQRNPPSPIEVRRMELQLANRICDMFGGVLES